MPNLTTRPTVTALADGDWLHNVDVSDTTDDPSGSDKKATFQNVRDQMMRHPTATSKANLELITGFGQGDHVYLRGYTNDGDLGKGFFWLDASGALGAGAANAGTIIDSADGTNYYWRRILENDTVTPQMFGAEGDGSTDDTTAMQAAIDSGFPVLIPTGEYIISQITIPTNSMIRGMSMFGHARSKLTHKAAETGAMIVWPGTAVNSVMISSLALQGNDVSGETYGLDTTGFRNCKFQDLWFGFGTNNTGFRVANVVSNGVTGTSDTITNTFINCRFNNSRGMGYWVLPTGESTVANTFLGCEFAGNGWEGIRLDNGASFQIYGCVVQQNAQLATANREREIYIDEVQESRIDGYVEQQGGQTVDAGGGVELTRNSRKNIISVHSVFGLASTFLDNGRQNTVSVRGEGDGHQYWDNPLMTNWRGSLPEGIWDPDTQNLTFTNFTENGIRGVDILVSTSAFTWMTLRLNRWYGNGDETGSHDGADGAAVLTDSGKTWTTNEYVNYTIRNTTDGSSGTITANTGTTVTATLAGGQDNDWDTDDKYVIESPLRNDIAGHWVTLTLDMDTRLFSDTTAEMRVYSQLDGTVLGSGTELHVFDKPENFVGRKHADVEFKAGEAGPKNATHDAATSTTVLTDSGEAWPTADQGLQGWKILNLTDGSEGVIISNTATTATVKELEGGTDNDFDNGDVCLICPPAEIRFSPSWSATAGTNNLRLRGMWVTDGQQQYTGNYQGRPDYLETIVSAGLTTITTEGATEMDSAAGALTLTLGSGSYVGQRKTVVMTDATNSSTLSVTNHITSDPEVFTLNAVNEHLILTWTGEEWVTIDVSATV